MTVKKGARTRAPKEEAAGLEFSADKTVLSGAVDAAARVASAASGAAVMTCAHLELKGKTLTVTAVSGDLEVFVASGVTVAGEHNGKVAVPARPLADIIRACPDSKITLAYVEGRLRVVSGKFRASMVTVPEGEFPKLPVVEGVDATYPLKEFVGAMSRVLPAASKGDASKKKEGKIDPYESLVLDPADGRLVIAATDSFRLSRDSVTGEGPPERVLITSKAMSEVLAGVGRSKEPPESVECTYGQSTPEEGQAPTIPWVRFAAAGTQVLVRPIGDFDYPQYAQLIPDATPTTVTIGRKELTDAIARMRLMLVGASADGSKELPPVHFVLGSESIDVLADSELRGFATETLEAVIAGDPVALAFNAAFLSEVLRLGDGDKVEFGLTDSRRPALITFADLPTYAQVLMPVRVSEPRVVDDDDATDPEDEGGDVIVSEQIEGTERPEDEVVEPAPEAEEPAEEPVVVAAS